MNINTNLNEIIELIKLMFDYKDEMDEIGRGYNISDFIQSFFAGIERNNPKKTMAFKLTPETVYLIFSALENKIFNSWWYTNRNECEQARNEFLAQISGADIKKIAEIQLETIIESAPEIELNTIGIF